MDLYPAMFLKIWTMISNLKLNSFHIPIYRKISFHSRINVHFAATFWENISIAFFSTFQNDAYYLPKKSNNGFKL